MRVPYWKWTVYPVLILGPFVLAVIGEDAGWWTLGIAQAIMGGTAVFWIGRIRRHLREHPGEKLCSARADKFIFAGVIALVLLTLAFIRWGI